MKLFGIATLFAAMSAVVFSGVFAQDADRPEAKDKKAAAASQADVKEVDVKKGQKSTAVQRSHAEWFEDDESGAKSLEEAAQKFITKHDKNKDGKVTKEEVPAHLQDGFARIDRNKDNSLSSEELQKHAQRAMHAPVPVQVTEIWILDTHRGHLDLKDLQEAYTLLSQIDADNDREITKSEVKNFETKIAGRMCERCFVQLDTDKNDQISREEAQDSMFEDDFTEIDADNNNQLTRIEIEKAVQSNLSPAQTATRPDEDKKELE